MSGSTSEYDHTPSHQQSPPSVRAPQHGRHTSISSQLDSTTALRKEHEDDFHEAYSSPRAGSSGGTQRINSSMSNTNTNNTPTPTAASAAASHLGIMRRDYHAMMQSESPGSSTISSAAASVQTTPSHSQKHQPPPRLHVRAPSFDHFGGNSETISSQLNSTNALRKENEDDFHDSYSRSRTGTSLSHHSLSQSQPGSQLASANVSALSSPVGPTSYAYPMHHGGGGGGGGFVFVDTGIGRRDTYPSSSPIETFDSPPPLHPPTFKHSQGGSSTSSSQQHSRPSTTTNPHARQQSISAQLPSTNALRKEQEDEFHSSYSRPTQQQQQRPPSSSSSSANTSYMRQTPSSNSSSRNSSYTVNPSNYASPNAVRSSRGGEMQPIPQQQSSSSRSSSTRSTVPISNNDARRSLVAASPLLMMRPLAQSLESVLAATETPVVSSAQVTAASKHPIITADPFLDSYSAPAGRASPHTEPHQLDRPVSSNGSGRSGGSNGAGVPTSARSANGSVRGTSEKGSVSRKTSTSSNPPANSSSSKARSSSGLPTGSPPLSHRSSSSSSSSSTTSTTTSSSILTSTPLGPRLTSRTASSTTSQVDSFIHTHNQATMIHGMMSIWGQWGGDSEDQVREDEEVKSSASIVPPVLQQRSQLAEDKKTRQNKHAIKESLRVHTDFQQDSSVTMVGMVEGGSVMSQQQQQQQQQQQYNKQQQQLQQSPPSSQTAEPTLGNITPPPTRHRRRKSSLTLMPSSRGNTDGEGRSGDSGGSGNRPYSGSSRSPNTADKKRRASIASILHIRTIDSPDLQPKVFSAVAPSPSMSSAAQPMFTSFPVGGGGKLKSVGAGESKKNMEATAASSLDLNEESHKYAVKHGLNTNSSSSSTVSNTILGMMKRVDVNSDSTTFPLASPLLHHSISAPSFAPQPYPHHQRVNSSPRHSLASSPPPISYSRHSRDNSLDSITGPGPLQSMYANYLDTVHSPTDATTASALSEERCEDDSVASDHPSALDNYSQPFDYSFNAVRRVVDAYLTALNLHSASELLSLFSEDPLTSSSTGYSSLSSPSHSQQHQQPPEIYSSAVFVRWGIQDGHLSGRHALKKHFEKGFEMKQQNTPASAAASIKPALQRVGSLVATGGVGDDAHMTAEFVALLPGPTKQNWLVLYRRGSNELINANINLTAPNQQLHPISSLSTLVGEMWELTDEGRIRCIRVCQGEVGEAVLCSAVASPCAAAITVRHRADSAASPAASPFMRPRASASVHPTAPTSASASSYYDDTDFVRNEPHYAFSSDFNEDHVTREIDTGFNGNGEVNDEKKLHSNNEANGTILTDEMMAMQQEEEQASIAAHALTATTVTA